jgi:hypothetical protein
LATLVEKESVGYSSANRRILNELMALGIVCIKTAGIRRTVVVADPSHLADWMQANYPEHSIDPDSLPVREGNIVRSGGSKRGKRAHEVLPFQFKWFGSENDRWTRMTKRYGLAAVLTDKLSGLTMPATWRLLTVENWEPFFRADYTRAPGPVMVAYLGGNVSGILIDAMKTFHHPPESVLHFGDYDWEGLYIFQRLQTAFPSARLHIPDNIDSLFKRYGDRKLIDRQKRKSAFDMGNRACRPVIRLIEQTNSGLEQEIVDLPEGV